MEACTVYLLTLVITLIILFRVFRNRKYRLPPGPSGWPVIGNAMDLQPFFHWAMTKWAKEYGDIYTYNFGKHRTIVLSDPKLVREAFSDPLLSGRPDGDMFTLKSDGPHGIMNSEGKEWTEQRRFTLRHLREFGFGKSTGEELITNEMKEFLEGLERKVGQPTSLNKSFGVAVLNTLWMIMSGVRYEQDDPRLWSVLKQNEEFEKRVSQAPLILFFPKLGKLFPKLTGYDFVLEAVLKYRNIAVEHIERHLKEINYEVSPRDFIDVYLQEIKATTDPTSSFYKDAGMRSLISVVGDLFSAGSETTSHTLSWLILHLAKFQHVQEKLHAELDEVVGKSRSPILTDRPKMPYTEAVIAESMRMSCTVPVVGFHRALQDVKFHDYDIPKGTLLMQNLHYIHHDPKIWGNPEEFQPERFLSADGKSFKKHEALTPFSIGKRACLGETLARDTIFLYFTNLFHRFSIRLADDSKDATLDPAPGFLLAPQDFNVILHDRL